MKEFPIGTVLKYPLYYFKITWYLQVVPKKVQRSCLGCIFTASGKCCAQNKAILGKCGSTTRTDNGIIFKLIYKKMNTNEIKIEIPKGMMINVAQSNLDEGIIKFKKKCPTYDQMVDYIFRNGLNASYKDPNIVPYGWFKVICKFNNIALYFNGCVRKTDIKYYIQKGANGYYVASTDNTGLPGFVNKEDAELVIENFEDILNKIF